LITENGNENLSERVPKFIDDIENLMSISWGNQWI
jgi:hypothetical protein